jgi:hypothetical protein
MISRLLLLLIVGIFTSSLFAKPIANPLPVGLIGASPVGLIFPGFNIAGSVNPAALPSDRATGIALAVTPEGSAGTTRGFGSIATTDKKIGIGAGYLGTYTPTSSASNLLTHAAFAGLGFRMDSVQLGASVRNRALQTSGYPTEVDFGFLYTNDSVTFGGVAYAANTNLQPGFGIGYKRGKTSHIEANILMPVGSSATTLLVAGAMSIPAFDIFFSLRYLLGNYASSGSAAFGYIFGVALWPGEHLNFVAQYESFNSYSSGNITAGLTVFF